MAQRFGEIVVIAKGLTPGETVVTEGQLRLEQGTKVQPGDTNGTPAEGGRRGGRGGRGQGGDSGGRGPSREGTGGGQGGKLPLSQAGRLEASAQEHLELLDALLARDEEAVREVMNRHLGHVRGLWAAREEH